MENRIKQISTLGQAIWLDFISRDILANGHLAELVAEGVTGVTSNPTIFHKAMTQGELYDDDFRALADAGKSVREIYESLAIADIQAAADVLRTVYDATQGRDGFVSLEVSPDLAYDTEGTIAEARRLFAAVNRPNVMIKVPATTDGLPVIETLIGEGINVNVTLIFALEMYEQVIDAYLEGLRRFRSMSQQTGRTLSTVSSVASFFVSRVDTVVDDVIKHRVEHGEPHLEPLAGRAAVANAKLAYALYKEVFEGPRFRDYQLAGARVQRPLWASTSTKNPNYADTMYVDPLIGVNTVNTMPPNTLDATRDHGVTALTIEDGVDAARGLMEELEALKVDMKWVTDGLLTDGVKKFADSFDQLMADLEAKRKALTQTA